MTKKISDSFSLIHEYDGFDGIDRTSRVGGITDIVNFRLMNDKTLKKREAAVWLKTLISPPRAHYVLDGENMLLLLKDEVIRLNLPTLSQKHVGLAGTFSGDAQFLCYDGKTFLLDGKEIFLCGEGGVSSLDGYAPLYGKNWHPTKKGKINQRPNLLSKHHRISYLIDEADPKLFLLDMAIENVDAAYVNGQRVSEARFSVNDGGFSISCSLSIAEGSTLTLFLTAQSSQYRSSALRSCTRAAIFGDPGGRGADTSSIAFYNGDDPSLIFATRRIDADDFADARSEYSDSVSIYVTASDAITVGNGMSPINAVCKRGGKLLVFTPELTYILSESGEVSRLSNLSAAGGCSSPDGAAPMGDSPVTVSGTGILKWTPTRYDSEEYIAECISLPIGGLPDSSFYKSSTVYPYRRQNEIWFTDPHSDEKRIYIYNHLLKAWYCFCGISADSFFEADGKLGFFSGKDIYLFDGNESEDVHADSREEIKASITTGRISFGGLDLKKRLHKVVWQGSAGGELEICITDAFGNTVKETLTDISGEQMGYAEEYIPVDRSRYYTVSLTTLSRTSDSIYGFNLTAVQ